MDCRNRFHLNTVLACCVNTATRQNMLRCALSSHVTFETAKITTFSLYLEDKPYAVWNVAFQLNRLPALCEHGNIKKRSTFKLAFVSYRFRPNRILCENVIGHGCPKSRGGHILWNNPKREHLINKFIINLCHF